MVDLLEVADWSRLGMFEYMVVWALAAFSAGYSDICSPSLEGRAPDREELSAAVLNTSQDRAGDELDIRMIGDHKLIVVTHRSDLPELVINGAKSAFSWHNVSNISTVVLEQCGLGQSALSVTAGSAYGEWISPDFFDVRPVIESEASSLRTISFPSKALGGNRYIYLVVGAGWSGADGDPLLISGDGLAGGSFGAIVEALSKVDHVRPIAFASSHFGGGRLDNVGIPLRSAEYHLPGESASKSRQAAYTAHETFFFDEFLPFIIEQLGGEVGPIYTFGVSSSASFALEQGLKRGDTISGIIAASPPLRSTTRSLASQAKTKQDIRLWCGTLENVFCAPIKGFAKTYGYSLETRRASHVSAFWEEALSASLVDLFSLQIN